MKFKVSKMECNGCANLIKSSLLDEFPTLKIDLDNKIVDVDLKSDEVDNFKNKMSDIGFDAIEI